MANMDTETKNRHGNIYISKQSDNQNLCLKPACDWLFGVTSNANVFDEEIANASMLTEVLK